MNFVRCWISYALIWKTQYIETSCSKTEFISTLKEFHMHHKIQSFKFDSFQNSKSLLLPEKFSVRNLDSKWEVTDFLPYHPVCFFSAKFKNYQLTYSTTEKETLPLLLALWSVHCIQRFPSIGVCCRLRLSNSGPLWWLIFGLVYLHELCSLSGEVLVGTSTLVNSFCPFSLPADFLLLFCSHYALVPPTGGNSVLVHAK